MSIISCEVIISVSRDAILQVISERLREFVDQKRIDEHCAAQLAFEIACAMAKPGSATPKTRYLLPAAVAQAPAPISCETSLQVSPDAILQVVSEQLRELACQGHIRDDCIVQLAPDIAHAIATSNLSSLQVQDILSPSVATSSTFAKAVPVPAPASASAPAPAPAPAPPSASAPVSPLPLPTPTPEEVDEVQLVWAKLGNFPLWPARLVTSLPEEMAEQNRAKLIAQKQRKSTSKFVQFVDTLEWAVVTKTRPFNGLDDTYKVTLKAIKDRINQQDSLGFDDPEPMPTPTQFKTAVACAMAMMGWEVDVDDEDYFEIPPNDEDFRPSDDEDSDDDIITDEECHAPKKGKRRSLRNKSTNPAAERSVRPRRAKQRIYSSDEDESVSSEAKSLPNQITQACDGERACSSSSGTLPATRDVKVEPS